MTLVLGWADFAGYAEVYADADEPSTYSDWIISG